jgi:hypothetical protein
MVGAHLAEVAMLRPAVSPALEAGFAAAIVYLSMPFYR